MVVITLKVDIEVKNSKDEVAFALPSGFTINTIRYSYLPSHYVDKWPDREETERRYFIIYICGQFLCIPKEHCEVPISYRGWYNI